MMRDPDRAVGGLSVRPPGGVELRPLARDDFEVALRMLRELYLLPPADSEPHRARYDAHINSVDAASFLALADGAPAGLVVFTFRRRLNHATYEGWVSDLYVAPGWRGRGVGRALMRAAMEEWRLRRGHRFTLETGHDNIPARRLYESLGMTDRGKLFQLRPITVRGVTVPPDVEIRRIDETDFDAVTRLLAELKRPAPTEETLPALRRTYVDHCRREATGSLIASLDGEPAGFISLEFREPFAMLAPQAWIPDLVVSERFQGRRLGAALLDAALGEARRRGAYAAVLESGHQRLAAHQLYLSAGMQDVGSFYALDRDQR